MPLLGQNRLRDSDEAATILMALARLRDGVTRQAALADMKAIAAQLEKQYPGSNQGQGASVMPLSELIVGTCAADPADAAGRRGFAAADCVRECGESAAGAL